MTINQKIRTGPVLAALLILLAATLGYSSKVMAVEFISPPGQNVPQEEAILKDQVTNLARSLFGEDLVEVVVNIGYARTGTASAGKSRVKLPGFNSFIDPAGDGTEQVVPEFVRIRQIFVMVSKNVAPNVKALEQTIITQGNFDRKKGDWVQVIPVDKGPTGLSGDEKSGQPQAMPKRRPRRKAAPSVNEPESTLHLLKARTSYFKGDYDHSLREILKAISIEPNSAQAYSMLGSLYYTINWKNLALKYWEIALELEPENKEVEELVNQLQNSET